METVTSADGTRIAYQRSGAGPPLVLVHGATADHTTTWRFVRPAFEERFTVLAMDRRGRGASGDGPVYDLAREAEDVAAVIAAAGEPAHVIGHSFGALCALEASRLTPLVLTLVLYEGVPLGGVDLYAPGVVERLATCVDAGDAEGALVTLLRDIAALSDREIEAVRSQTDAWARRLVNVATAPRELAAEAAYVFDPARFASMTAPALLLVGGASPSREHEHARGVAAGLGDARIAMLSGEGHAAMHTAPELFLREVVGFLGI